MAETERGKEISIIIQGSQERQQKLEVRVEELRLENASAPEDQPIQILNPQPTPLFEEIVLPDSLRILNQNKPKGSPQDSKFGKDLVIKRKIDKDQKKK